jgi:hypothetical protein
MIHPRHVRQWPVLPDGGGLHTTIANSGYLDLLFFLITCTPRTVIIFPEQVDRALSQRVRPCAAPRLPGGMSHNFRPHQQAPPRLILPLFLFPKYSLLHHKSRRSKNINNFLDKLKHCEIYLYKKHIMKPHRVLIKAFPSCGKPRYLFKPGCRRITNFGNTGFFVEAGRERRFFSAYRLLLSKRVRRKSSHVRSSEEIRDHCGPCAWRCVGCRTLCPQSHLSATHSPDRVENRRTGPAAVST